MCSWIKTFRVGLYLFTIQMRKRCIITIYKQDFLILHTSSDEDQTTITSKSYSESLNVRASSALFDNCTQDGFEKCFF